MKVFFHVIVPFILAVCIAFCGDFEIKGSSIISNKAFLHLEYSGSNAHNRYNVFYTDNLLSTNWSVYCRITFTDGVEELELSEAGFYYFGDGGIDSDGDGLSDSEEELVSHTNPFETDSDGDGISDYEEQSAGVIPWGGRVRGGKTGDSWLYVDCGGYDMDVEVYGEHRVIIPKGTKKVFLEVIIFSAEYPVYTSKGSIFNDEVAYRVELPYGILDSGRHKVNDLHNSFSLGRFPGGNWEAFFGEIDFSELTREDDSYIDLYGSAMNKRDGLLASGVYLGIVSVPGIKMQTDYNHDRQIDEMDVIDGGLSDGIYYFWVNDDKDEKDISEGYSDVPYYMGGMLGGANYNDWVVNGRGDMHDFFPVWLDIGAMVKKFGIGEGMRYVLRQGDGGLNGVYTDLSVEEAGNYLIKGEERYGSKLDKRMDKADVFEVTANGIELSEEFLGRIEKDKGKGIILFEGRNKTKKPLVMEVVRKGLLLGRCELKLSIDSVEEMYRWINLRGRYGVEENRATDLDEPENYPDNLCIDKNFIFVHGYSVDEEAARGWNAEMFKRLYWSGSKAKYVAVTWFGNDSQKWWLGDATPDYHLNVIHALETGSSLANDVNERLGGDNIIAGHSLGNMVVSSGIAEYGLLVNKYMILNGAVAAEAYDGTKEQDIRMIHEWWRDYDERAWSANWYKLFEGREDARKKLRWNDKFADITFGNIDIWNFYSEGDEVFELTEVHSIFTGVFDIKWWFIIPVGVDVDFGRYAWQKQEIFKGTKYQDGLLGIGATKYGGWGFENVMTGPDEDGRYHVEPLFSAEESWELTDAHLRLEPIFRHYPHWLTDGSELSDVEIETMLAKGIPALTPAIGRTRISSLDVERQIDINVKDYKPNGWPMRDKPNYDRWLHSDIKNMAYYYTYKFFDEMVNKGEMK